MFNIKKICVLLVLVFVVSCTREVVYEFPERERDFMPGSTYDNMHQEYVLLSRGYTREGVKVCPVPERCNSGFRLPPQPCYLPMPTYYSNITQPEIAEGALLIHPYTRAKVLCLYSPSVSVMQCAENYRAKGYVLVTDIPQAPAKYDFLTKGTYPTRKWRNGGAVYPRF